MCLGASAEHGHARLPVQQPRQSIYPLWAYVVSSLRVQDSKVLVVTVNCSQTKFVAIVLVLSVFYAIFRLPIFRLTLLTFRPQKLDKQVAALSALRAFQLCFSSNCFRDLYLWCEGRLLEVEDTPLLTPPPNNRSRKTRNCIIIFSF